MKKLTLITIVSATFIFGIASLSMAGHHYNGCSGMKMSDLSTMDTDNDGVINMDEFAEPHMEKYRGWFKVLDTNEDGFLSQEEWEEFRRVHGYSEKSEG
jgi:Ca2+-binding EF-hand superfamily protein